MQQTMTFARRRTARGLILAFVLGLHALVWLTWRMSQPSAPGTRATAEPPPLIVRLLAPPAETASPHKPPAMPSAQARRPAASPAERPAFTAQPITMPSTADVAASPTTGSATPPVQPASAPLRLDLTLRQAGNSASPEIAAALDDRRVRTPKLSWEQRTANRLDPRVREEVLDDGRLRLRQGDDCVIVAASRHAQLNPINQGTGTSPRGVMPCR